MNEHSNKWIHSWISIISLLSFAWQNVLNQWKDDDESSKHENEWPEIFRNCEEHLNKISIFFLVSNILKQFNHRSKNDDYFDQIINKLYPVEFIRLANIYSNQQVNLKENKHNHVRKVIYIWQIIQKSFANIWQL